MLICLDAGHCLSTPGKRCLKEIDPNETREWTLNGRVADKVQQLLACFDCETMRVDDVTGREEITLYERVTAANRAGADLYLSIHHNAGINGGSGGGIVVYVCPGADGQSRRVQKAVYSHTVTRTGLWGNRANPTPEGELYVLNATSMPAVLGEFGFMDSTVDTPIILTETYADRLAAGIVEALAEVYGLKKVEVVTYEQWREFMRQYEAEQAQLSPSDWAEEGLAQAVKAARETRVPVVVAGLPAPWESEGFDREGLALPEGHDRMIRAVAAANPRTVVVLLGGGAMELPWRDCVAAILYMGLPGQAGGEAAARLLTGVVVPSGKLAETWPRSLADVVSRDTFGRKAVEYREGLYVGYRYYESAGIPAAFPFGHGLS